MKEEDRGVYLETSRRRRREDQIIIKPIPPALIGRKARTDPLRSQ